MNKEIFSKIANGRTDLKDIVREIAQKADPEKILLISASYDYRLTEDVFIQQPQEELKNSHYSLLILGIQEKSAFSVKSMRYYRSRFASPPNLQLFFMDIHEFNEKLEKNDPYATEIASNAMIWYDKGEISLHPPTPNTD